MTNEVKAAFDTAFADFNTDGVPSSGTKKVKKSEVRNAGQVVQAMIDGEASTRASADSALNTRVTSLESNTSITPTVVTSTWAVLASLTGSTAWQKAEVRGTDAGTHTDPVVGGTVANTGVYGWSTTPAGWQRIADLDDASDVRSDVGTNPAGVGGGQTLFQKVGKYDPSFAPSKVANNFNKDNSAAVWGSVYSDSTGAISTGSTFAGISGNVPVSEKHIYTISMLDAPAGWQVGTRVHCYNAAGTKLASLAATDTNTIFYTSSSRRATFRTPAGCAYVNFNLLVAGAGDAAGFTLAKAATIVSPTGAPIPYRGFGALNASEVRGLGGLLDRFARRPASRNLYDPQLNDAAWQASYITGTPQIQVGSAVVNSCASGKMPIMAGQAYTFSLMYARTTAFYLTQEVYYWDANGDYLSKDTPGANLALSEGQTTYSTAVFTPPSGAYFASFNIALLGSNPTEQDFKALRNRIMLNIGSKRLPFEPFAASDAVTAKPSITGKGLIVQRVYPYLYVRDGYSANVDKVEKFFLGDGGDYTSNGCARLYGLRKIGAGALAEDTAAAFEASTDYLLTSIDDPAPKWINGLALGGDHGFAAMAVPATGHGKTNVDVGQKATDTAGKTWVLARVVDANNLVYTELPGGTATQWTFTWTMTGTTLTYISGGTHTNNVSITGTPTATQLWSWIQRQAVRAVLDGGREVDADGVYTADEVSVVQTYGIPNARSVVDDLIANVGSSSDPVYNKTGTQTQVEIQTTYSWRPGELLTVAYDWFNVQDYLEDHAVGTQCGAPTIGSDKLFLFVPRSTAVASFGDFSTPVDITTPFGLTLDLKAASFADINDPPERFAFLRKTAGGNPVFAYMFGYSHLVGLGLPAARKNIAQAFQMLPSNKGYPWCIDAGFATVAPANEYRGVLAYRGVVDASGDANVICQGVYSWGGKKYWVANFVAGITNKWVKAPVGVHSKLVGKKISVSGNGKAVNMTTPAEFVSERGLLITTTGKAGMIAEIG